MEQLGQKQQLFVLLQRMALLQSIPIGCYCPLHAYFSPSCSLNMLLVLPNLNCKNLIRTKKPKRKGPVRPTQTSRAEKFQKSKKDQNYAQWRVLTAFSTFYSSTQQVCRSIGRSGSKVRVFFESTLLYRVTFVVIKQQQQNSSCVSLGPSSTDAEICFWSSRWQHCMLINPLSKAIIFTPPDTRSIHKTEGEKKKETKT